MTLRERIALVVWIAVLWAGSAGMVGADQDEAYRLRREGRILPLSDVIRRAQLIQPGRVLEAEIERRDARYIYELEIADREGRVHHLQFDAETGEWLSAPSE